MVRRSGRKTKAPNHFDPFLPIHESSAHGVKKDKRPKRSLLTLANAFQPKSPILKEDIQLLFATTISNWSSMDEENKQSLINAFPPTYRIYNKDEAGKLKCPISEDFAASDRIIKRDVARFKGDIEAGFYVKRWQEEGKRAMKERAEGQFDDYIKQHAEDGFGAIQEDQEDHEMVNGVAEKESDEVLESDGEKKAG
jgi:hypothetical protein